MTSRRGSVALTATVGALFLAVPAQAAVPGKNGRIAFSGHRALTPAASAARASDHPCSTTLRTIVKRPFGPSGALA